jgi:hypothetical protein
MPRLFGERVMAALQAPRFSFWDWNLETPFRRVKFSWPVRGGGECGAGNQTCRSRNLSRSNHPSKENLLIKK